jgi:hypothetical protein
VPGSPCQRVCNFMGRAAFLGKAVKGRFHQVPGAWTGGSAYPTFGLIGISDLDGVALQVPAGHVPKVRK